MALLKRELYRQVKVLRSLTQIAAHSFSIPTQKIYTSCANWRI
jgi:hypothetical protein